MGEDGVVCGGGACVDGGGGCGVEWMRWMRMCVIESGERSLLPFRAFLKKRKKKKKR